MTPPNINLLPKYEQQNSYEKLKTILIGFVVLLCVVFLFWHYFSSKAELEQLETTETTLLVEQSELLSKIETTQGKRESSLQMVVSFVENISYDVSPLIDEIQQLRDETMYLRNYEFGSTSINLNIDFEMLNDVSMFVDDLNNSAYFTDVQVGAITQFQLDNQTDTTIANVPRYSTTISLTIDQTYLAAGGTSHE